MDAIKEFLSWLSLLGAPTFVAVICCFKKYSNRLSILMKAVQAQMRSELLQKYYKAKELGFISSEDLDDWENLYQSYHALGKNGVLDKRRDELFTMPTKLEE